jgi:hypothetical protein
MQPRATLFLCPHPDDLVYSAFAAAADYAGEADALVFFNVSRFTKWGLLPKNLVTIARTVEEKLILRRLRLRSSFLWKEDSSSREGAVNSKQLSSYLNASQWTIRNLFCPLGIANHPDHLAVRDVALEYWSNAAAKPKLCLYEDLPYAARIGDADLQLERCLHALSESYCDFSVQYWPLSQRLFKKKLFFSRLYLTQNDHTDLLEGHARELGRRCQSPYAERYVCSE